MPTHKSRKNARLLNFALFAIAIPLTAVVGCSGDDPGSDNPTSGAAGIGSAGQGGANHAGGYGGGHSGATSTGGSPETSGGSAGTSGGTAGTAGEAGTSSSGGAAGQGGAATSGGDAGAQNSSGSAGVGGQLDTAGAAGDAGNTGDAGNAGAAGSAGSDGNTEDPEARSCAPFKPCGGDSEGTWKFIDQCNDDERTVIGVPGCDTAITEFRWDLTGEAIFKAGSYDWKAMSIRRTNHTLPGSCLGKRTCEEYAKEYARSIKLRVKIPEQVECSASKDGGCACTSELQVPRNDSGTYVIEGTTAVTTSPTTKTQRWDFCVKGDSLKLDGLLGRLVAERAQ